MYLNRKKVIPSNFQEYRNISTTVNFHKKKIVSKILWSIVGICGEKCVTLKPNTVLPASNMRFLGNIEAKTDAKGRAFLPAVFRKVLNASGEESLVLRKDIFEPCLVLYPQSVWNERMDTLRRRLSRWSRRDQMIYRQYVTDVEMITLDGNGRFLIPKRYMKMVNIDQQIRFTGMDDCIEIWAINEGSEPFMSAEEFSKALEETMGTDGFFFPDSPLSDNKATTTKDPTT